MGTNMKFALGIILAVAPVTAQASDWRLAGASPKGVVYVDRETLVRDGQFVTVC